MMLTVLMAFALQAGADQDASPALPPAAPVMGPSSDAMIDKARELTSVKRDDPCANRQTAAPDEILVCKARDSAYRLPLPDERGPPDRARQPTGDARSMPPGAPCPPGGCTGINLLAVPGVLFKIAKKIIDPDS